MALLSMDDCVGQIALAPRPCPEFNIFKQIFSSQAMMIFQPK